MADNRKLFGVFHCYEDSIGLCFDTSTHYEDLLFISDSEETANTYVEKWDNTHVYENILIPVYRGSLVVKELPPMCLTEKTLTVPPWELAGRSPKDTDWLRKSFDPSYE